MQLVSVTSVNLYLYICTYVCSCLSTCILTNTYWYAHVHVLMCSRMGGEEKWGKKGKSVSFEERVSGFCYGYKCGYVWL